MMASSSSSLLTTTTTLFSNSATSRTLLQITTQQQNQTTLQSSPPPITSPSFRPSIPIIIGIITILLAITFLILLYTRHRNSTPTTSTTTTTTTIGAVAYYLGGSHHHHHHHNHRHNTTIGYGLTPVIPSSTRKNSGVDRTLIESLPVFRFGSLRGRNKDGLECAVCLNRFEPIEVLRLLPKCKHAFHVECVDTWLDAHSTCPLCRYRVDPEDLLLLIEPCIETVPVRVMDQDNLTTTTTSSEIPVRSEVNRKIYTRRSSSSASSFVMDTIRRVAGRHSSAGEMSEQPQVSFALCRRSYDEVGRWCNERRVVVDNTRCFDQQSMIRKDGLLLLPTIHQEKSDETGGIVRKKIEHQIIISDESVKSLYKRWSDVLPSDLLYLRSKMVMNDARRRFSLTEVGWRRSVIGFDKWRERRGGGGDGGSGSGRSMSEMTGVSRVGMV